MRSAVLLLLMQVSCLHQVNRPAETAQHPEEGWATMSWEDRHDEMTFGVLSNMAKLFQKFDGKRDPDMTCRTCHGANAEQVHYKMPNGLPALALSHLVDPSKDPRVARVTKFMVEEVTPRMAELLDVEPYDPETRRGFGCLNCHPAKP